jgi:hypothetical protein
MTILTVDWLARESLMILQNNLVATLLFDREYEGDFTGNEARGDTIRIKRRDRGNAQEFTGTINARRLEESKVDLKLEKHFDASFEVTSREMTLDLDSFSDQILEPQVVGLAELVDAYALSKLQDLPSFANVDASNVAQALPTASTGLADLAQARKIANIQKIPMAGRVGLWDPELEAAWLSVPTFVEADKKGDDGTALAEASLGRVLGINHFMAQNVDGDTGLVAPAAADVVAAATGGEVVGGATVAVTGLTISTTFPAGSPITIDHADGGPYNYILAADLVTDGGGAGSATLYDPVTGGIIRGEPLKAPVTAADVVTINTATAGETYFRRGAIFNSRAFAFASVPLAIPPEAEGAVIADNGVAIRVIRDYDISTKQSVISLDVLVGCKMVHGELGVQYVTAT